jgi:hypothetical protein
MTNDHIMPDVVLVVRKEKLHKGKQQPRLAKLQHEGHDAKSVSGDIVLAKQLKTPFVCPISKLWMYLGSTEPSRVSMKDLTTKDLKKRVRSMTKLTSKMVLLVCLAAPFDANNPLPKVSYFVLGYLFFIHKFLWISYVHSLFSCLLLS